ncbi:hypothetical protein G6F22_016366 [Rhizopus arrhizus]|nr:hypothetical protein G6F22_016366 [Rhizopus arrhizus]
MRAQRAFDVGVDAGVEGAFLGGRAGIQEAAAYRAGLRQLHLQVAGVFAAHRARKARDGGDADARLRRQLVDRGAGAPHDVVQDGVGDLAFSHAQCVPPTAYLEDEVADDVHVGFLDQIGAGQRLGQLGVVDARTGHEVAGAHADGLRPDGGLTGLGISPLSRIRERGARGSGTGAADSSARV